MTCSFWWLHLNERSCARLLFLCGLCVRACAYLDVVHDVHQALVQPALLLVGSTDGACAAVACECCSRLEIPILSLADDTLRLPRLVAATCDSETELPPPNPIAHIIFTSGSSGHPKAVFCDHRGSLLSHNSRIEAIHSCEISTCTTSSIQDDHHTTHRQSVYGCGVFGVWDAVAAHLHGDVAAMLPDTALRDADQLAALLAVNDVNRMLITPTCKSGCQHTSEVVSCAATGQEI